MNQKQSNQSLRWFVSFFTAVLLSACVLIKSPNGMNFPWESHPRRHFLAGYDRSALFLPPPSETCWNQMVTSSPKWFWIYHRYNKQKLPSWWFQPIWKNISQIRSFSPSFGMNIKQYLKPPPPSYSNESQAESSSFGARIYFEMWQLGPEDITGITGRFGISQVEWNAETSKKVQAKQKLFGNFKDQNGSPFNTPASKMTCTISSLSQQAWANDLNKNYFIDYSSGPL